LRNTILNITLKIPPITNKDIELLTKDLRTNNHPSNLKSKNLQMNINQATPLIGFRVYPEKFYEILSTVPEEFESISWLKRVILILGDFKGILKFDKNIKLHHIPSTVLENLDLLISPQVSQA